MSEVPKTKAWVNWSLFFGTVIIVFIAGIFAATIFERKGETAARFQLVREIADFEPRNEVWGENFPRQFETYMKTLDTSFVSAHGGSYTIDYLKKYPELVILWAGYAFSKEYNQGRGHAYAIQDIRNILRTGGTDVSPMPSTCWTCKTTDFPRLVEQIGLENVYNGKWKDFGHEMVNPIGCQDCHDPKTMDLRITRPALVEAFERQGKRMKDFTHNDMRSLVCAQCHVEYYFRKEDNYLIFPWDKGFSADDMEAYFDEIEFYDWIHALSKAPMLKAQHPDYELYKTGIHAKRGVACADCHMPYKMEGGIKFTDHHIRSPLANIAGSCQVCHRQSEAVLLQDVHDRQDRVMELRRIVEKILAVTHLEAKVAWDNGATEADMAPVLKDIRHAQWRWDWVAAANGVGFHAPVEALRVLGTSIQKAESARGKLAVIFTKLGVELPVTLPDFSTKEQAQTVIGLDMKYLKEDKKNFLENEVPEWVQKAKERQETYGN